jgi:hypothetical protein
LAPHPARQELPTLEQLPSGGAFPEQPAEFGHHLHEDDRLTVQAVADLADRLPRTSVIYDTAAQPLLVPQGGPPRGALSRPGDVIRNLDSANAWLTLLNIEADPAYAELMNTMLDRFESGMPGRRGARCATGWGSSLGSASPEARHRGLTGGFPTVDWGGSRGSAAGTLQSNDGLL